MDEDNLQQIKQLLLKIKSELLEQEKTSKETEKPVELDQTNVGRISRMDAMHYSNKNSIGVIPLNFVETPSNQPESKPSLLEAFFEYVQRSV